MRVSVHPPRSQNRTGARARHCIIAQSSAIVRSPGIIVWPDDITHNEATQPVLVTMKTLFFRNILGEAMGLRPLVQMASIVHETPTLQPRYGQKADA